MACPNCGNRDASGPYCGRCGYRQGRSPIFAALALLVLFPLIGDAAPRHKAPPIKQPAPALPANPEPTITREDLRRTVEHMQRLAREQQTLLDTARAENERVKVELASAQQSHAAAQKNADTLQREVNDVTRERNKFAEDRAYWKQKHGEAVAKLWKWRIAGGLGVALTLFVLVARFTTWGAKTLGPLLTKGVV